MLITGHITRIVGRQYYSVLITYRIISHYYKSRQRITALNIYENELMKIIISVIG